MSRGTVFMGPWCWGQQSGWLAGVKKPTGPILLACSVHPHGLECAFPPHPPEVRGLPEEEMSIYRACLYQATCWKVRMMGSCYPRC